VRIAGFLRCSIDLVYLVDKAIDPTNVVDLKTGELELQIAMVAGGGAQPAVLAVVERSWIDGACVTKALIRTFDRATARATSPPRQFGRELGNLAQRLRTVR
jgi:hypothetical protein